MPERRRADHEPQATDDLNGVIRRFNVEACYLVIFDVTSLEAASGGGWRRFNVAVKSVDCRQGR